MIKPETKKEFTDTELLHIIMEDVGRLATIEKTLQEESEHSTIYNRIMGIELRTYETVNILFSIKRLLLTLICLTGGIAFILFVKFFF